ncbi:MAG: CapA family protein [Bacteroidaceae bacterium]|nr:CapA family protein [Bacteroidaceae bacterium]
MKQLSLFSLAVLMLCCCKSNAAEQGSGADSLTVETKYQPKTLSLLFVGDLMQHGVQYKAALRAGQGKTYDYEEVFRYVKDEISSVDVAIGNFETTTAGGTPSTYPQFNAPDEYMYACKDAGFDILLTANNHSCDKASKGITRTIEMCDSLGLPHVGTYVDQAERDREYPYILEKNGFRIALLCYTYGTNGIAVPKPHIVNQIDTLQMRKDLDKAKQQNPDAIIAFVHWGVEHALLPNQGQKDLADWMFKNGVTHIIGGHPHVVQPIEVRDGKDGKKHLLAYSLGNYVSNMSKPNNDGGLMVKMTLTKTAETPDSTFLSDYGYSITWVSRPVMSGHVNYRIYPVSVPESMLNASEKARFNTTLKTERDLFKKHNKGIDEYQVTWTK